MLEDRQIDKLIGEVTVVHMSPNECGLQDDMDGGEMRIVGRRKAQKFVFDNLADGCVCVTKKVTLDGRTGTVLHLWSTKSK